MGGLHGALHLGYDGVPKVVRRPYELYDGMGEVAFDKPGIGGDDRFFVCAPMFHGGADVPIYAMLRAGGSVAIVQGFRTDTFWDEVRRWGCTVAWIHSAMSIFLAKAPPQDDDGDNPLRLARCSRRCSRACTTSRSASTSACSPFTG